MRRLAIGRERSPIGRHKSPTRLVQSTAGRKKSKKRRKLSATKVSKSNVPRRKIGVTKPPHESVFYYCKSIDFIFIPNILVT